MKRNIIAVAVLSVTGAASVFVFTQTGEADNVNKGNPSTELVVPELIPFDPPPGGYNPPTKEQLRGAEIRSVPIPPVVVDPNWRTKGINAAPPVEPVPSSKPATTTTSSVSTTTIPVTSIQQSTTTAVTIETTTTTKPTSTAATTATVAVTETTEVTK